MYARNLPKNNVRASPGFMTQLYRRTPGPKDENSYRTHIPPGYAGNRFRSTEEPETKRHSPTEEVSLSSRSWTERATVPPADNTSIEGLPALMSSSQGENPLLLTEEGEHTEPSTTTETSNSAKSDGTISPVTAAFGDLLQSFRGKVSFEDLLLVFLILTLAMEGEGGGETILLLALLLLVK